MTLATNPLEAVAQCLVAIVNADSDVQALTGRSSNNIVWFVPKASRAKPVLAFLAHEARPRSGTNGEHFDVDVWLRAEATDHKTANALLRAACEALTVQAFTSVGADAVIDGLPDYTSPPDDDGSPPSTNRSAVIAEAEFTIWITL